MDQISDRVIRHVSAHPEWVPSDGGPGGWARDVATIAILDGDGIVLVDPQLGPGLEELLARVTARPAASIDVVIANAWHARSAQAILDRYGGRLPVAIHAPRGVEREMPCVPTHVYGGGDTLPGGVVAHAIAGLHGGEHALWIAAARALVTADALLGAGGDAVRLPPVGWSADPARRPELLASVARLRDLPIDVLLPSHGEPVRHDGRDALAAAVAAAEEVTT